MKEIRERNTLPIEVQKIRIKVDFIFDTMQAISEEDEIFSMLKVKPVA